MRIQSLSIAVPNKKCVNNCAFCVAQMQTEDYKNQMDTNLPFFDLYQADYIKRLEFARDNGCNTVMLTGNSEPQQNKAFLQMFGTLNNNLKTPFRWIELQTTGVMLDEPYLRFLRNHVGVSTISLSISSFNDIQNIEYIGAKTALYNNIEDICKSIKKYDFNLRLSINLTDAFNDYSSKEIFRKAKSLGADQVTFRLLYSSKNNTPQDKWIEQHRADDKIIKEIEKYVLENGIEMEKLEFGAIKYSVDEIGTVLDMDCMSKEVKDATKFLILRENCKLYSRWDDKGSLIF